MEHWIVTAASSNFYDNLLTSFIASLRETAGWKGNIGVMNYGLTPHQTWTLEQNGIKVIPPLMRYKALIDDRFTTIAHHFKGREAYIAEWDLDMWFCREVESIFTMLKPNQLSCTYDSTYQGFMTGCVNPDMHESVGDCIEEVRKEITHVLQGGFIAGDTQAWDHFSGYQDTCIKLGIGYDAFGIDMVALNLFKHFWPERVKVLGVEWNCLPEWQIQKKDGGYYCRETDEPLRAIHVSSPNRKKPYMYETHYPEEFKKWLELLS